MIRYDLLVPVHVASVAAAAVAAAGRATWVNPGLSSVFQ